AIERASKDPRRPLAACGETIARARHPSSDSKPPLPRRTWPLPACGGAWELDGRPDDAAPGRVFLRAPAAGWIGRRHLQGGSRSVRPRKARDDARRYVAVCCGAMCRWAVGAERLRRDLFPPRRVLVWARFLERR